MCLERLFNKLFKIVYHLNKYFQLYTYLINQNISYTQSENISVTSSDDSKSKHYFDRSETKSDFLYVLSWPNSSRDAAGILSI